MAEAEPVRDMIDEPAKPSPSLVGLLGQLADDTRDFARAEIAFLKAQTGERVGHAIPGIVALLVATTLCLALIIAIIVTLMIALAAIWGTLLGILSVTLIVLAITAFCGWWGARRVRAATKARERR